MNEDQKKRAIQIWHKYSKEGEHFTNASKEFTHEQLDQRRAEVIPEILSILQNYLSGKAALDEFKTKVDSINKRNRLWGFKGINGQMFFNMLTKISLAGTQTSELEMLLKRSLALPSSPEQAMKVLEEFAQFTKSLAKFVDDQRGTPKTGSIPFFLSYFWQIQSPQVYPVYYTSMINVLQEHNLWTTSEKIGESYFWHGSKKPPKKEKHLYKLRDGTLTGLKRNNPDKISRIAKRSNYQPQNQTQLSLAGTPTQSTSRLSPNRSRPVHTGFCFFAGHAQICAY